ncbi:3-phosphoserine/phosphohydroxythreonine transaminase [Fredinandcohnia quinoae]|uniref:Phosphoserine aminotransferase n=1 Tax=Fredinandcohnia quinoae TaxID=2918902 RepID=A0AAW5ECB3_9BACI|nr:3-phosphoserine/phosphohydroxythreonine transaminase [Fredinandcohnia sp. SECRCQ15]MCH1626808.1 3-phosphoserine/phosphohydroxythreonine transaminase [Fredinandcohnia sp. SECRCQ15]
MKRAYNFNAGPSALPFEVLEKAQKEFTNFQESGMSIMEFSHRSKEYDAVHEKAITDLRELLHIPNDYHVLFLQGGASLQFSMVPLNFLSPSRTADYVLTGVWSEKAQDEAEKIGKTTTIASSQHQNYTFIPNMTDIKPSHDSAYVHLTSNNTIYGTEWKHYPTLDVPLIADMSSDILSKEIDINQFSMIYAGAQKNLGPAGVTVVIIKDELLKNSTENIPTMLNYKIHAKKNSLYNTPPTFSIYMLSLMLEWVKNQGGIPAIEARNNEKAALIYNCMDESNGFYTGHAQKDSRSNMNIVFKLPTEELTNKFIAKSKELGFIGLSGHRSVGGCRASTYNAVPYESCEALVTFMKAFMSEN